MEDEVLVDPRRKMLSLSFWLNKNNYSSKQALLWCLSRMSGTHLCFLQVMTKFVMMCIRFSGCDAEPRCSVADLRDADSASFFSCSLFPDSRVCGAYDSPLRRVCHHLLDRSPNNTYSKKGNCYLGH